MAGKINDVQLMQLVEAAIFAADKPLSQDEIQSTVLDGLNISKKKF
jgi:segregation and condensation protein B